MTYLYSLLRTYYVDLVCYKLLHQCLPAYLQLGLPVSMGHAAILIPLLVAVYQGLHRYWRPTSGQFHSDGLASTGMEILLRIGFTDEGGLLNKLDQLKRTKHTRNDPSTLCTAGAEGNVGQEDNMDQPHAGSCFMLQCYLLDSQCVFRLRGPSYVDQLPPAWSLLPYRPLDIWQLLQRHRQDVRSTFHHQYSSAR